MADANANHTQSTPQEVIISVIAGLLAPLLAIFLVVMLIRGIQEKQVDADTSEVANQAVVKRIQPFATLAALDASAPRVEQSGEQVFTAVCASCHTPGALGAPKFNSKGDWAARLGQGFDTLIKHAIEGIRQMPARGGNPDLSDIEVARAVAYMANSSGASFKEPEEEAAEAGAARAGKIDLTQGQAAYTATCAACHGSGVAGAPRLGDKAAWGPRLKQEFEVLYANALNGIRAMPAKGGNAALAEADLANAVAYMVKEAGGKIPEKAPGAAAVKAEKAEAVHAENTAPAAPPTVAVAPAPAKAAAVLSGKGEAVYKQTCAVCHAAGVAGAPKLGDKAAWGPRLAKGMEALYASGLKGLRAMPAKGGNPALADAEVNAAVDYMAGQAR